MEIARNFFEFAAFLPHVGEASERELRQGEDLTTEMEKFPIVVVLSGSVQKRVRKFDLIGNYARATKQKTPEEKPAEEKIVDEIFQGCVIESTSFFSAAAPPSVKVDAISGSHGTRVLLVAATEGMRAAVKSRREKIGNFLREFSDSEDPLFPLRFRLEYLHRGKRLLLRSEGGPRRLFLVFSGSLFDYSEGLRDERSRAVTFLARSSRMRARSRSAGPQRQRQLSTVLHAGCVFGEDYFFPARRPNFATQEFVASEDSWLLVADETMTDAMEQFLAKAKADGRKFRVSAEAEVSAYHHREKTYRFFEDLRREAEPAPAPKKSTPTKPQVSISALPPVKISDLADEASSPERSLVQHSVTLSRKLRDFTYLVISDSPQLHAMIRTVFLGTRCGIFFAPTAMEAIKYVMELKQYGNFEHMRILVDRKFRDLQSLCATLREIVDEEEVIFILSLKTLSPGNILNLPTLSGFRTAGELRDLMNTTLACSCCVEISMFMFLLLPCVSGGPVVLTTHDRMVKTDGAWHSSKADEISFQAGCGFRPEEFFLEIVPGETSLPYCDRTSADYSEVAALTAFYNALGGAAWRDRSGWLVGHPCFNFWTGIECNVFGKVTKIILPDNKVKGVLPAAISDLKALRELHLHNLAKNFHIYPNENANEISGVVPDLSALTELQVLELNNNAITGLPDLRPNAKLEILSVSGNLLTAFPLVEGLSNLRILQVADNSIQQVFPGDAICSLAKIKYLNIAENRFTGSFPVCLADLDPVVFDVSNKPGFSNGMTGEFPQDIIEEWVDISTGYLSLYSHYTMRGRVAAACVDVRLCYKYMYATHADLTWVTTVNDVPSDVFETMAKASRR